MIIFFKFRPKEYAIKVIKKGALTEKAGGIEVQNMKLINDSPDVNNPGKK